MEETQSTPDRIISSINDAAVLLKSLWFISLMWSVFLYLGLDDDDDDDYYVRLTE